MRNKSFTLAAIHADSATMIRHILVKFGAEPTTERGLKGTRLD